MSLLALLLVAGCGASMGVTGDRECTEIGTRVGVGVNIAAGVPAQRATVEACWGGSCRTVPVELYPSTEVAETTCQGTGDDAVCSARMRDTGGHHGFADIPDLPEQPVQVTLTVAGDHGEDVVHQALTLTPTLRYPNGRDCPGGGPQANMAVNGAGEVRELP